MRPQLSSESYNQGEFFKYELEDLVSKDNPLRLLSDRIDWNKLETSFLDLYRKSQGRPGVSIRLLLGLQIIKYTNNTSDEFVLKHFSETPVWQYFCGFRYFEHRKPCDATTLVKFRQKIGEEGINLLLAETVRIGKLEEIFKNSDLDRIHVDTTVQEKNITYPHDVKHLVKIHRRLLKALLKKNSS
jgi:IS5 family transposase